MTPSTRKCPHCWLVHMIGVPCDPVSLDHAWRYARPADQKRIDTTERENMGVYEARRRAEAA